MVPVQPALQPSMTRALAIFPILTSLLITVSTWYNVEDAILAQGVESHSYGYPLPWYSVVQPNPYCSYDSCLIAIDGFNPFLFALDTLFFAALGYLSLLMIAVLGILRIEFVPVKRRPRANLVLASLGFGLLAGLANWQWSKDVYLESYIPWFLVGSAAGLPLAIVVCSIARKVGSYLKLSRTDAAL